MHRPRPKSFGPSQYPEKRSWASSIQSHRYTHYRPASLYFESCFQKQVFNIGNRVVVLFRGSYSEEQKNPSKQVVRLKCDEALPGRFERGEHSLKSINWFWQEMERSDAKDIIKVTFETQLARIHLNNGSGVISAFVCGSQHFLRKVHARVFCSSVGQRNRESAGGCSYL